MTEPGERMDRVTAVKLLEFADKGTAGVTSAIEGVKQAAPGRGADFFDSGVSPIWGKFVMGIMAAVWDRHPDLAPAGEVPPDGGYDPDEFNLPKEVVIQAARSLREVQSVVIEIEGFLETADLPADEREWFGMRLSEIRSELAQALFNVSNQHPAFRGAYPKEEIPE